MVSPEIRKVSRAIPTAHEVDVSPLRIDAHLVSATMFRVFLHMHLMRVVVMMQSLAVAIGSESPP